MSILLPFHVLPSLLVFTVRGNLGRVFFAGAGIGEGFGRKLFTDWDKHALYRILMAIVRKLLKSMLRTLPSNWF